MTYREPWDTVDNADSQMARYPRNREGERARRPPPPSLFTNKTSYHHLMHRMSCIETFSMNQPILAIGNTFPILAPRLEDSHSLCQNCYYATRMLFSKPEYLMIVHRVGGALLLPVREVLQSLTHDHCEHSSPFRAMGNESAPRSKDRAGA